MAEPADAQATVDHSQRATIPFLLGVYLAVNAIRDLYLLVEGPDCTYMKTQFVQGNHDWLSTLSSVSGYHRIANTALHPSHMSGSREAAISAALLKMASHPAVPAVALTSMPMASVTGADYERLARTVGRSTGKPVMHVPGKSLSGDWLDGYEQALYSIACQMQLEPGPVDARKVAIVGNLFDRNEADHEGNIRELGRIVQALDAELCCVWLSGSSFRELQRVQEAGTIVSLPYGRKAASKLAARTGAQLVQAPLPLGFSSTEQFVRALGQALSRQPQAEQFIERELAHVVPKLEWVIPFVFQNRRMAFVGEPHVWPGLRDLVELVGASMAFAVFTNRPAHARGLDMGRVETLLHPKMKSLSRFLVTHTKRQELHLLITNNTGILGAQAAVFEFGFPSYFRHALYDRPFLGFRGALCLLDSLANAMRMHEAALACQHIVHAQVAAALEREP